MTQTYSDVTIASTDPSHSVTQMDTGQTDEQTDGGTDRQTDAQTDRSGPSHSLRRAVTPIQQRQHTIALL